MLGGAAESGEGRGGARRLRQGGTLLGARGAGSAHVVWVPQRVVAAAAATGEGEEVARRRWFEFVRESPCERMGQRVAEVATGYGKATDPPGLVLRAPPGAITRKPSGGFVCAFLG